MTNRFRPLCAAALLLAITGTAAMGQMGSDPIYRKRPASVAAPVDRPFDGVVDLHVDATDVDHKIFTVRQRISVTARTATTLPYPQWEAASHGLSLTVDRSSRINRQSRWENNSVRMLNWTPPKG